MNTQDIEKLARLSRLHVSEDEMESYAKDFDGILGYIESITSVDVSGYDTDNQKSSRVVYNAMREDEDSYEAGEFTDAIMNQVPDSKDGYVKVKKIL